jgi:parallel beta-helix repeat protein
MGIVGHRSENITMRNLQVIPTAGTVTSTNTDATHFTSCKGKILFDACKFGGQGDDCTNIHNYYWCFNKESNDNIRISLEDADLHALSLDYPDVGDTLALVARNNLDPVHYYVVRKVRVSQEEWKVTVSLDKPIEYDPDEFYLTNLTRRPSVDIINNTVRSHMARAFLIKTRDVRISGNVIQNSSGTAIQLGAESGWRESGPVENVLIEHNLITGCGYGHGRQKGTAISVEVNGVQETSGKINKNVIIQNNVIEGEGNTAIYVSATQGIRIENNEISGSQKAISIENSESIKVKNNGNLPVMIKN